MEPGIAPRLVALRRTRGLSQEDLAAKAAVGLRTIQRLERGQSPGRAATLAALAAFFNIDVSQLTHGPTETRLAEVVGSCTCPSCGALVVGRHSVSLEYGDDEVEIFECGYTRGSQPRPCPRGPDFPGLEDYEFWYDVDADGSFWCYARGKTDAARQVHLQPGPGRTQEQALAWIHWSYRRARGDARSDNLPPV
jgi:DNA-binding XRE family transcriptional regulator